MKQATGFSTLHRLWRLLSPSDANRASHSERLLSALGGGLGILAVLWVSSAVLDHHGATLLVASMGASAVLLFAVPHGALSQPWSVFGGHLVSAAIGVTCARYIPAPMLAAALAVGLAIGAMYFLRCLHPPGGASALVAVLGGDAVRELGYGFILSPVLVNAAILITVAVLFNLPFHHRRYPSALSRPAEAVAMEDEKTTIAHSDLVYALSQIDSFIDVSEQDLLRIYALAVHHPHKPLPCQQAGQKCTEGNAACYCQQARVKQ